MPLLNQNQEIMQAPSGYKFSMTPMDDLGAAEYTLVGIVCDASSSVSSYAKEMESCKKQILESCKRSPRSENLMMRDIKFNTQITEIHGFKLLSAIDPADYDDSLQPGGCTALYDSTYVMLESIGQYGKMLTDQDFDVNAIMFVITDGEDNQSKFSPARIKKLRDDIARAESLESILIILVGVGNDISSSYLDDFKNQAGLDQAINVGDASEKKLARLAQFVSQSISSQSQALGTGGPSVSLTF